MENGEGIKGIVFAVDDADHAMSQGSALGLQSHYDLDYDQSQIDSKCQGRFTKYKEYFISAADPLNTTVLLGEFNEKALKQTFSLTILWSVLGLTHTQLCEIKIPC